MEETQYSLFGVRYIKLGHTEEAAGGFMEAHTMLLVSKGSGDLYLNGVRHRLKAKAICYCPPGTIADIRRTPNSSVPLELYELQYDVWESKEQTTSRIIYSKRISALMDTGKLPVAATHEALVLAQELYQFKQSPGLSGRLAANLRKDAVFKQLMGTLLQSTDDEEREQDWLERMKLAVDYVEKHFAEMITRNDMAKRVGLTPEHFSVSFKRATGSGFTEYLTRLRLEKAREELLNGEDRNLDRIAREIGYQDGLYLSRKFKQYFGYSPRDYIQRPKRIVALQYVGHLLALGLTPAGTSTNLLRARPYAGRLGDVADVGDARSLQRISSLQPDLIVTSGPNSEPLSQLAPTILLPWGREDTLDELLRLGRALNREREAKSWIDGFREKDELAAAQVAKMIGSHVTAAVFEFWADRIWAVNMAYGRGLRNLYRTFSFRPPGPLAEHVLGEGVGLELTPDMLAAYAADYMFVTIWESGGGTGYAERVMNSKEWRRLPAVRNGRVFFLDLELFKYNDPLALEQQLTILTELLTNVHRTAYGTQ
ncbi:helix-turn-helix domain-containing protein [Paenibacillus lactis]|uniref:helix-turn-helix domain-containing protein n=1 Tax=Paenibacillus lactis TaxID=228574 RepID=UPI00203B2F4A|nr:helix-turn-helix domain-containing protein [Paenibacillus lactis]MCM3495691.1 helix-turn-helix domain-containing protein [Paenibacillus lactis]